MTASKRPGRATAWMARPLPGLLLLAVLTVLAILVSWSLRDSAGLAYWLSAQLIPVLYGVLAWGAGRGTDAAGPASAAAQATAPSVPSLPPQTAAGEKAPADSAPTRGGAP